MLELFEVMLLNQDNVISLLLIAITFSLLYSFHAVILPFIIDIAFPEFKAYKYALLEINNKQNEILNNINSTLTSISQNNAYILYTLTELKKHDE